MKDKERLEKIKDNYKFAIFPKDVEWLIEQAERVEYLKQTTKNLWAENRYKVELEKENKRYREGINDIKRTWKKADNIYNHVEKINEIIKALEGDPNENS